MSGICGIVNFDGAPVDPELLKRMAEAAAYRGLDGIHYWVEGNVGLAHLALHTTPESIHEHQPLINHRGDLILVADARVDNREDLIRIFTSKNCLYTNNPTDADLIMAAYDYWGESCREYLLGDFAFAIWDSKRQTLFCVRDHFGVRQFCYHLSPGSNTIFSFASDIKSLLKLPWLSPTINNSRIYDYLTNMQDWDKTSTFYNEILLLPPAHSIQVNNNNIHQTRYWELNPKYELKLKSTDDYSQAFRELFFEAVRCRSRSHKPIGAMLSGGLDSSAIVCSLKEMNKLNSNSMVETYSTIFDSVPESDEREFIQAIVSQGGVLPNFVPGDQSSPFKYIDSFLYYLDEPVLPPNLFLNWAAYQAVNQPTRVILDGFGGDQTLYGGLICLTDLARSGKWITLLREANSAGKLYPYSKWYLLWDYAISPFIPKEIIWIWRKFKNSHISNNKDFINENLIPKGKVANCEYAGNFREKNHAELTSGAFSTCLSAIERISAAKHLEIRFPFLDKRLVEFCLALPISERLRDGYTRIAIRKSLKDILPSKIQSRTTKGNLSYNFWNQLKKADRPIIEKYLFEETTNLTPFIKIDLIREEIRKNQSNLQNIENFGMLWYPVNLALWLKKISTD